jgi:hypothetical protein
MAKIEKLTDEQMALTHTYMEASLAVGLATGPSNREEAEKALLELYDFCGVARPVDAIFFVRSPREAQRLIAALIQKKVEDRTKFGATNDEQIKGIIEGVEAPSDVYTSHGYSYGNHECYWIWYYKYMREVLQVPVDAKAEQGLNIMERLALNSHWHYVFPNCAIVCDRPDEVHLENRVLSNEEGPAFRYSDGFECYAIEGHIVTEQIVMSPETLTLKQIDDEQNAEVRRIMIQRYGVAKYLMETGAKIIDTDPGLGLEGSAMRGLIEDNHNNRWLIGSDGSTGREYHMPVPNTVNTCAEAHQAISGLNEGDCLAEA